MELLQAFECTCVHGAINGWCMELENVAPLGCEMRSPVPAQASDAIGIELTARALAMRVIIKLVNFIFDSSDCCETGLLMTFVPSYAALSIES